MSDKVRTTTLSTVGPLCSSCEDAVLLGQKKGVSDYFPLPPHLRPGQPGTNRTTHDAAPAPSQT